MKCIPINLSGLLLDEESSVMEMDDVFEANMESDLIIAFNLLKTQLGIFIFNNGFNN